MLPVFFALVKPASTIAKTCLHPEYQCCSNKEPDSENYSTNLFCHSNVLSFLFLLSFFHFIENKIYKKTETLHQFPQLRGSAKCLHFIIMLN